MSEKLLHIRSVMLMWVCLCFNTYGWSFSPLEVGEPPVNGTDQTEDPAALRGLYGFGNRPANKMVEHAGTVALEGDVKGMETPHVRWANDYAEKPIRVLWVTDPKYDLRGPIEIRQRSNFEIAYLMIPAMLIVHPEDKALADFFAAQYDALLSQEWDVIVMRHYAPRMYRSDKLHPLTASVYTRIEEKVRNGCGLVCQLANQRWYRGPEGGNASVAADNKAYSALAPLYYGDGGMGSVEAVPRRTATESPVSDGIAFAAWPVCWLTQSVADPDAAVLATAGGYPAVATGSYGKGRVVGLHYETALLGTTGLTPHFDSEKNPEFGDYYESVYALWLRALAWAAGKEPKVGLQAADVTVCRSGAAPDVAVRLTGGSDTPATAMLNYRLTDRFGDRVVEGERPVSLSATPIEVRPELPVLHANGDYRLDLWVKAGGKTYNWGTAGVRVEGGADLSIKRIGEPPRPGDAAEFKVLAGSGNLHILALDGNDRVFFDRNMTVAVGDTVKVDTSLSALPANRVFFTLHTADHGAVLARRALPLYLPRIGLNSLDGQFLIASYGPTDVELYLSPYAGLLYRAVGIDGIYWNNHHRERLQKTADAGLYNIGGKAWQFPQKGFSKVHQHTPNNPANRKEWSEIIAANVEDFRAFGAIGRVLDDESWFAYTGLDGGELKGAQVSQDPWSLDLFREAMQARYGEITALNDMWGTDFASFADVRVIEEDEVKNSDNPSGWLEFREYMNWTYAERYYGWVTKQHETALGDDFRAGCGAPYWTTPEGGATYRGGDMDKMRGNMRFMMLYGGGSPGDAFVGQPGGQKYDPPEVWRDYGAWSHVLTGADALWYYFGNALVGSELAWRRHAEWIREGIDDIVRGCGALLSGARGGGSPVRVVTTAPNDAMGWLFAKRKDAWQALGLSGGQPESARTFRAMMGSLFVGAGGLSESDLEAGAFRECKLLFLPQQVNLSDAAVEAIRKYVREGGILVADILPATRSQMGKPRGNSALADVFGVDFSAARLRSESESWYSVGIESPKEAGERFCENLIWLPNQVTCLGLKPTTAVAHAKILSKEGPDAPGCLINTYGQGKAMLLNFVHREWNNNSLAWHRLFGEALLAWADIEPEAQILDPLNRAPLPYRPLYTFKRGKATLLGSLRGSMVKSGGAPVLIDNGRALSLRDDALFAWRGKRHAYNTRTGEYLGFTESATIDLPSFQGRLLCLLPYKVEAVALRAPEKAKRGMPCALEAQIQTNDETPGEHVLYFEVVSPTGATRPLYSATRAAPDGRATFQIPFAYNDPMGEWRVVARDAMTGVAATARIVLEDR